MKKIAILIILSSCLGNFAYSQEEARVILSTRVNQVKSYENATGGPCWESGTEEYSAWVYTNINDSGNPLTANSGCLQCNNNGNCTYGQLTPLVTNRNTSSPHFTTWIRAWENDDAPRCSPNGGDDCVYDPSPSHDVNFRLFTYPSNGTYSTSSTYGDTDYHTWSIDYSWKYSDKTFSGSNVPQLNQICSNQVTATAGAIRAWVVDLKAQKNYVFEITSGPDTYLRLFGPDGYTIVAADDNSGAGNLSKISYTPTQAGRYFIEVSEKVITQFGTTTRWILQQNAVLNWPIPPVIYVNKSATGANNGASWAHAFTDLQTALHEVGDCVPQIWVAAGTYYPDEGYGQTNDNVNAAFVMKNNLSILGGFPNTGNPGLGQRNPTNNPTILSGDIGTVGVNSDNSRHVIYNNNNALNSTAVLDGFTITKGNAAGGLHGGGMYNFYTSPSVSNCSFTFNVASGSGGGMHNVGVVNTLTNCSFSNNSAGVEGGGIYNGTNTAQTLVNCSFTSNSAVEKGGGILSLYGALTLSGCSFTSNASTRGAGMFNWNSSENNSITDCTFSSNIASNNGGGMENSTFEVTVSNCSFNDNQGCGMFNSNCSPTVTNCSFTSNTNDDFGGGMSNLNASPNITDCSFTSNAAQYGAGMSNGNSSPTVTNCTFTSNTLVNGQYGGFGAGMYTDGGSPILNNCSFTSNSGGWRGGGMYIYNGSPVVNGCTFTSNSALYYGGGMSIGSSTAVIKNSKFELNSTDANGGAMSINNGSPSIINCSFLSNSAQYSGGAIETYDAPAKINNCSFTANSGSGGSLYCYNQNQGVVPKVANCIMWGNGNAEIASFNHAVKVTYSIVQGGHGGAGNLNENPLFIDPANGDLHLLSCSPAVNAGHNDSIPAGISTDLDGNARIYNGTVDMGAYEWNGGGPPCNQPPVAVCQNITASTNGNCQGTAVATAFNNGSSDPDQDPLTFSVSPVSPYPLGVTNVILTVSDNQGASSTCTATITVQDNVAPTALCKNTTVQLNAAGTGSTTTAAVNNNSSDACGIASLALSKTSFNCSNVGANVVILTVTDNHSNTATCTATVTVQDNVAPTALCKNTTVQLNAAGNGSTTTAAVNNNSSDACGIASMVLSATNFTCANVGANAVTLTVTDNNSNTATCTATVTVQDNVAPVATCQNVTVELNAAGNGSSTAAAINNGSSDACGIASLALSKTSFNCSNIGANAVTLTVTDNNSNTATCTATVTVQDNVAPVATCQNVIVQLNAAGTGSTTAAAVNNGSSDACGIASLTLSATNFTCANVGANSVTLTVTDNNSNTATCSATVTVQDNVAPTAICQNVTVQLDAAGTGSTTAVAVNNGSSDVCGNVSLALSKTNFNCNNVGANTVILTVTDNQNNAATCSATVTVEDNVAPDALCKNVNVVMSGAGQGSTSAVIVNNGSTDACGIASMVLSQSIFTCANVGANAITMTVTDNNGNTATCASTVTVYDYASPVTHCQSATIQLDATGNGILTPEEINNGSTDACGIASLALWSQTSFTCADVGASFAILAVTDVNGNTGNCAITIYIEDNVAPTALCQNVTVQLDATGNGSSTAAAVNNGSSDACGIASMILNTTDFSCESIGANAVTLTVTDNNSNTATCTATVTIQDNIAPTITCPAGLTVPPNIFDPCAAVVNGIDAVFNDNCSGAALAYILSGATTGSGGGQSSGQTFLPGNTTVTYTVTDGANLSASCTFSVTVNDCNTVFSGTIKWEQDGTSGVQNTTVHLTGNGTGNDLVDANGDYEISLPYILGDFTLTPTKTINKLNGVTSADVTAIQQHVTNSAPLPAPFKRIAADVNKSNSITTFDATVINQALLGNPSALAQIKTSWRFVPGAYTFPNPDAPWGFPEQIDLTGVSGNVPNQDFLGIKTGDVIDTWANPANFGAGAPLVLRVQDQVLQAGQEIIAEFRADQLDDLSSFQFALYANPEHLELLAIDPIVSGLQMTMDNFGIYNLAEGEIRTLWTAENPMLLDEATGMFRLRFKALESGAKLSEVLQLNEDALAGHVYNAAFAESGVELRFTETTGLGNLSSQPNVQLLQNRPNPFTDATTIGFVLPESCEAQLRIYDLSGRVLVEKKAQYAAGKYEEVFDLSGASGVLCYELVTPSGTLTRKMVAVAK